MEQCLHKLETLIQAASIEKAKKNGSSKAVHKQIQNRQLTPIESPSLVPVNCTRIAIRLHLARSHVQRVAPQIRHEANDQLGDVWGRFEEAVSFKSGEDSRDDGLL